MFFLTEYTILIYFIFISIIIVLILFLLAYFLAPKIKNNEKISVYECGFQPFQTTYIPYDVHFYIIAISFLIFDIEVAIIYPAVVNIYYLGFVGFVGLIIFILVLVVGFVYEWKKNIFN
jgi:NADH-quinone oxidoreductase subunit A